MAKIHMVSDDGRGRCGKVDVVNTLDRQVTDGLPYVPSIPKTDDWTQVTCKTCLKTYVYPIGLRNNDGRRIQGDPSHGETMHSADLSKEAIVVHPWGPSSSAKVWPALCGSLSMTTTTQGDKAHCTDCLAIMSEKEQE